MSKALSRNLHIPLGRHRESGANVTVLQALQGASSFIAPSAMSREDQIDLVIDAWRAGLWDDDILTNRPEPITLEVAETEIRADDGDALLSMGLTALEMLHRHVEDALSQQAGEG